MTVVVVDASVAIKWFVPEIRSDAAVQLLERSVEFLAPDLLFVETANAVWKKVRRGELRADRARKLVSDMTRMAVDAVPSRNLVIDAYPIADVAGLTVYDATYLALAVRLDTELVTADAKLYSRARRISLLAERLRLL